ncbi:hypothetical protein FO059_05035 [Tomitella fengzijianii]|uniref:Uncharacterized protein n=1 Tax=Tomitella fengzijianii TaxID=2597660 RepID=A0A516X7K1_9ACTN|nr:hypothetical protein FO059_05035 [Tomitella fengzijianii]
MLLLAPGGVALLAGLDAALLLLGVGAPVRDLSLTSLHGVLMVLGFVGTVVSVERAVALGRTWGFLAPAALGGGAILLLTPAPRDVGAVLFVVGTAALVAVYLPLWRRNAQPAVLVQAAGGVLALGGTGLWLGGVDVPWLLPWLVGFLVLTIAGERLELAHVALTDPRAQPYALGIAGAVILGTLATLLWPQVGYPLLGLALAALVAWLLRYDIAMKTVRASGLPRFSAACLLAGYAWLTVTALIWVVAGPVRSGPLYDASVHAVLLGFVISMIMAHAPIIFPAVLRRPLPYRPAMYAPAILLHASLALRIIGGDARGVDALLQWGGVLNVAALLAFVVVAAGSVLFGSRPDRRTKGTSAPEPVPQKAEAP